MSFTLKPNFIGMGKISGENYLFIHQRSLERRIQYMYVSVCAFLCMCRMGAEGRLKTMEKLSRIEGVRKNYQSNLKMLHLLERNENSDSRMGAI